MVTIPLPAQRGQAVGSVQQDAAGSAAFSVRGVNTQTALAQDMDQLGAALQATGERLQKKREDAKLMEIENRINQAEMGILDPKSGLISRQRGSASGITNELDGIYGQLVPETDLAGLTPSARQAVQERLRNSQRDMWGRVAAHEETELDRYRQEQSAARVALKTDASAADPYNDEKFQGALAVAEDEAAASMLENDVEQGSDAWNAAILDAKGEVVSRRVAVLSNTDAAVAQAVLDRAYEEGNISATAYNAKTAELKPKISAQKVERAAAQAVAIQRGQAGGTSPLQNAIDATEGGADYNTLYGHSQKGGRFSGVTVSTMTLDEMDRFEREGGYGDWVASKNNGVFATPAGRYQIVGATRRRLAEKLGLDGDTVFDAATQDLMFNELVKEALEGGGSMADKRARLRGTWVGLQNVSDAELDAAIAGWESGEGQTAGDPEVAFQGLTVKEEIDARALYGALMKQQEDADKRVEQAAATDFYQRIDDAIAAGPDGLSGQTFDTFVPPEQQEAMGDKVVAYREFFDKVRTGQTLQTDPLVFGDMADKISGVRTVEEAEALGAQLIDARVQGLSNADYTNLRNSLRKVTETLKAGVDIDASAANTTLLKDATKQFIKPDEFDDEDVEAAARNELYYRTDMYFRAEIASGRRTTPPTMQEIVQVMGNFAAPVVGKVERETRVKGKRLETTRPAIDLASTPIYRIQETYPDLSARDIVRMATDGELVVDGVPISGPGAQYLLDAYEAANPLAGEEAYGEDAEEFMRYIINGMASDPRLLMGVEGTAQAAERDALRGTTGDALADRLQAIEDGTAAVAPPPDEAPPAPRPAAGGGGAARRQSRTGREGS